MYTISKTINSTPYSGLKSAKLFATEAKEVLFISLEQSQILPEHTSPRDAHLIVLEGEINFHINKHTYTLQTHDTFDFPKDETHWVEASENAKFLVIR